MRADRLLSMLMLLQTRGRMTARRLAEELEISERTVYRDVEALGAAGIPVYAERGPYGGIELLDRYRTTLTGLSADEVRALFLLSIPAPLDELGMGREVRAALLKLAAALPAARRSDQEHVRRRIHLDWTPWFRAGPPAPHLRTIQHAVWADRMLDLHYRSATAPWIEPLDARVAPYGLVAKAGDWHLVCARKGSLLVVDVARVLEARVLNAAFSRPKDFDLTAFWKQWCREYESNRPSYPVLVRIAPELAPFVRLRFGEHVQREFAQAGRDAAGWATTTLRFETLEEARQWVLGYGGAVEVLEPLALRMSVADFGRQIVERYHAA